jgi:ornithine cyclodeaminase
VILLTDADVRRRLTPAVAVRTMRQAVMAAYQDRLVAPPRAHADLKAGAVTVTAGASADIYGYRVYDSLPHTGPGADQLVAVHDRDSGRVRGLVVGRELGGCRTGALGAVAVDALARRTARVLGLIGAGREAWYQLWAIATVRGLTDVRVFARREDSREQFADRAVQELGVPARPVRSAREAVLGCDIVVTATTSTEPVLDADWLASGVHLNTLGPKTVDGHETPVTVADRAAVITTDSLAQTAAYGSAFFLTPTSPGKRLTALGAVVCGAVPGRRHEGDVTLFCSVGLAGTEVLLAAALFEQTTQVPDGLARSSDVPRRLV